MKFQNLKEAKIVKPIIGAAFVLFVFLLGWIPHRVFKAKARSDKNVLKTWYELGHKPDESLSAELIDSINHAEKMSKTMIYIPFILLAVCGILLIVFIVIDRRKTNLKLKKVENDLNELKK